MISATDKKFYNPLKITILPKHILLRKKSLSFIEMKNLTLQTMLWKKFQLIFFSNNF